MLSTETHLLLHRSHHSELVRQAQHDTRAVQLLRLRRRERAAERALTRVRLARLAVTAGAA